MYPNLLSADGSRTWRRGDISIASAGRTLFRWQYGWPENEHGTMRAAVAASFGFAFLACLGRGADAGSSASPAPEVPPARAQPASKPSWRIAVTAAADGTKAVVATLPANAPIVSGFGTTTPSLVLRFRAGQLVAYVMFDTFLGEGDVVANVRFGSDSAEQLPWRISRDGRAVIYAGDALALVDRLKRVDAFSISVAPEKRRPVAAAFSITEMDLVIKALISAGISYSR